MCVPVLTQTGAAASSAVSAFAVESGSLPHCIHCNTACALVKRECSESIEGEMHLFSSEEFRASQKRGFGALLAIVYDLSHILVSWSQEKERVWTLMSLS